MKYEVDLTGPQLNDAAWAFVENTPPDAIPPVLWNDLKLSLKPAIEAYLNHPDCLVSIGIPTVTRLETGEVVAVTMQDEEHRILSVVWQRPSTDEKDTE